MNYNLLISIVFSLLFSCKNQSKSSIEYPENLFAVISDGKTIESSYSFCSTVAVDVDYSYRVGIWTFKSKNEKIIARGEYDLEMVTINNHGGCPYSYQINTVDLNKWKFWDSNGFEIQPTERLISLIKLKIYKH